MTIDQARRVAAAFAGGMGMGSECGAVTGSLIVIGLKYGKTLDSDSHANVATLKHVATFIKEFKGRHNHLSCYELLESNMATQEGINSADGKGISPHVALNMSSLLRKYFTTY
jgi:C_GCAxxG_C_C family probable redox protein